MKKRLIIALGFVCTIIACSKNGETTAASCTGTQSFASDVDPIIQSYCAISGCHASGSNNGPGALTTYQQVYNNRSSIRQSVANGSMPQNNSLSSTQRSAIICWIDNGGSNN